MSSNSFSPTTLAALIQRHIGKEPSDLLSPHRLPQGAYLQALIDSTLSSAIADATSPQSLESTAADASLLRDFLWEQLHTGKWSDVDDSYRRAYTLARFAQAFAAVRSMMSDQSPDPDRLRQALRQCDDGIIMGAPIPLGDDDTSSSLLHELAETLHDEIRALDKSEELFVEPAAAEKRHKPDPDPTDGERIDVLDNPSLQRFQRDYFAHARPCLIRSDTIRSWPAMHEWRSAEALKRRFGERTVPVEIGRRYTDAEWTQRLMTVGELLRRIERGDSDALYLAQYELFEHLPSLRDDIDVPDYCLVGSGKSDDVRINAWLGARSISPLHFDPKENLFVQVVGRKYVRLYAPSQSDCLYANDGMLSNTSRVDVDNPDSERFPEFSKALFADVVVEPGDMLYIPKRHWHYVRSLSALSFSVSFWFE